MPPVKKYKQAMAKWGEEGSYWSKESESTFGLQT